MGLAELGSKLIKGSVAKLKVMVCHWLSTMAFIISDCVVQGSPKFPFCSFREIRLGWFPVIPADGTYIFRENMLLEAKLKLNPASKRTLAYWPPTSVYLSTFAEGLLLLGNGLLVLMSIPQSSPNQLFIVLFPSKSSWAIWGWAKSCPHNNRNPILIDIRIWGCF